MHSHLKTLKFNSNQIIHEDTPLDKFENNFMKEASYSWNPPICSTLTAVCKNNIDDQLKIDDFIESTQIDDQNDNNHSFIVDLPNAGIETMTLMGEIILVNGSPSKGEVEVTLSTNKPQNDNNDSFVVDLPVASNESINLLVDGSPGNGDGEAILSNNISTLSEAEISHESASSQNMWILSGISKITELTLDLFENNYKLFAQKLVDVETDLVIRAILLKNNVVIFLIIASEFKVLTTYMMPQ